MLTIETAQLNLSGNEQLEYKNLFKWILYQAKHPDPAQRLRGNIVLSLDGNGGIKLKTEAYRDLKNLLVVEGNGLATATNKT